MADACMYAARLSILLLHPRTLGDQVHVLPSQRAGLLLYVLVLLVHDDDEAGAATSNNSPRKCRENMYEVRTR